MNNKCPITQKKCFCRSHKQDRPIQLEMIIDHLQDLQLRVTTARKNIIKILLDGHHAHSMNALIQHLKKLSPKTNLTSVYNNLETLIKAKVIKTSIDMLSNEPIYEIAYEVTPHIHWHNQEDLKKGELEINCELHQALKLLLEENGFILKDYMIHVLVEDKKNKDLELKKI